MCGRVIQSSEPLSYGIVEGMDARDSRVHNYPPRWNGAPSQDLLVIRRNHDTGKVSLDPLRWGLVPYWCKDPKGGRKPINAKCETVHSLPTLNKPEADDPSIVEPPAGCKMPTIPIQHPARISSLGSDEKPRAPELRYHKTGPSA
jgi:putative SOS response-associated peptidase YedK